eukprot:697059-Pelagomonas_calceolata.AAC.1
MGSSTPLTLWGLLKSLVLILIQPSSLLCQSSVKLHAHSVQYAYKLSSTKRALEKTPFNSHHRDQAWATASNPPDPR